MIKFILILITILNCKPKAKDTSLQDGGVLALYKSNTYSVSLNLGNVSVPNSMVYFSAVTTSNSLTKNTTTESNIPIFTTSTTTDENGNLNFVISVGTYQALVTTIENRSLAFKIKIEPSTDPLNKDGKATITDEEGNIKVVVLRVAGAGDSNITRPSSFVCGYNPKGDTAPPEIKSVELVESNVSLSSGSGVVSVKVKTEEGFEGDLPEKKASGIKQISARLFSPNRINGSGFTTHSSLKLNSSTGFYEGKFSLTNFVENGTWKLGSVIARDNAGNEREFILEKSKSETNYSFNACGQKIASGTLIPSIEITGSSPDTDAPIVNLASVILKSDINAGIIVQNPIASNIDISSSLITPKEVEITITATVTDAGGTGIASGVNYIDTRLQSFSWWQTGSNFLGNFIYVRLDRVSGTELSGTYSGKATIRSFAEGFSTADGQWKLGGICVKDKAGNSNWTNREIVNKSFTILNASTSFTADFYPPELKSASINKTSVAFDETFKFTLDVADTTATTTSTDQTLTTSQISPSASTQPSTTQSVIIPSGVKKVTAEFYSPLKLLENSLGTSKSSTLVYNEATKKYEGTLNFPSSNNEEGGTWKLAKIELVDRAGNQRLYKLSEGYNNYTYTKISKTDGDLTNSFVVSTIVPVFITRN